MKQGNGTYTDLMSFALLATIMAVASLAFTARNMVLSKRNIEKINVFNPGKPIPSYFTLPCNVVSPAGDDLSRKKSLYFQIAGFFESFYKIQGLRKGYLRSDDFTMFSEQHLIEQLADQKPSVADISQFFDLFSENKINSQILKPLECCKYQGDDEKKCENMQCPNTLDFSIRDVFKTSNMRDVKQRLVESELPLALTYTELKERYVIPCTEKAYTNEETCKREDLSCSSGHCLHVDFAIDGEFGSDPVFRQSGRPIIGASKSALIFGFSDNFIPKSTVNITNSITPIGGFIVKTAMGERGHSYEYLSGLISEDQEQAICPNSGDPMHWIPASLECLQNNQGNIEACGNAYLKRGEYIIRKADELICFDNLHCNNTNKYVLIGNDSPHVSFSPEGMPLATVAEINGTQITPKTIKSLPFHYLGKAFKPTKFADNSKSCGFTVIAYEQLAEIMRSPSGSWVVHGANVEFSDKSFAKTSKSKDYTAIIESTVTKKSLNPQRPLQEL